MILLESPRSSRIGRSDQGIKRRKFVQFRCDVFVVEHKAE